MRYGAEILMIFKNNNFIRLYIGLNILLFSLFVESKEFNYKFHWLYVPVAKLSINFNEPFDADNERAISCELPNHIEAEITYTEPGVKGDTATNSLKPATIHTGVEVRVPLFINTGDFIKVDTRTKEYSERVKK